MLRDWKSGKSVIEANMFVILCKQYTACLDISGLVGKKALILENMEES